MYILTIASNLGKWTGIVLAEALWLSETGARPAMIYYGAKISYREISKIAVEHAIDSNNAEKVTENLFDCLEFIE
jgi:hypothetical protein